MQLLMHTNTKRRQYDFISWTVTSSELTTDYRYIISDVTRSIYVMDLPALQTVPFLHGNRLTCLWQSPCWHRNGLARTASVLAYGQRGSPCRQAKVGLVGRTDNGTTLRSLIMFCSNCGSILPSFCDMTIGWTTDGQTDVDKHLISSH